jgi:hypothetical protein
MYPHPVSTSTVGDIRFTVPAGSVFTLEDTIRFTGTALVLVGALGADGVGIVPAVAVMQIIAETPRSTSTRPPRLRAPQELHTPDRFMVLMVTNHITIPDPTAAPGEIPPSDPKLELPVAAGE